MKTQGKPKAGAFQAMGLNPSILKGITHKGYKIPTPVQRKTIPIALEGRDLVAMARTGSGKTAAFLIPMFEKLLQTKQKVSSMRALILTPTRELALQSLKFIKELGKYTELRNCLIVGGDSMGDQFTLLHSNPDIIIATPGRFVHLLVEMNLSLLGIEVIIFDEADRLFEMGFQEQVVDICKRMPQQKQTLMFSATMPKVLADFAQAGLNEPVLVRLDVDKKLSENLHLTFLKVRDEDKSALLLCLLRTKVASNKPTVIFVATKHHVEYLKEVLMHSNFECSYIYGALDQTARKIEIGKFREAVTNVLIVTDVAARGLDLPLLDCVIHYHFPATPKLFIHRSGRVARAGRDGAAYALVCPNEFPLMLDVHLFLGYKLKLAGSSSGNEDKDDKYESDIFGYVPDEFLEDEREKLMGLVKRNENIYQLTKVCDNAMKMYLKSRQSASKESIKRSKEFSDRIGVHPEFASKKEEQRFQLLEAMKFFRPSQTIFEVKKAVKKSNALPSSIVSRGKGNKKSLQNVTSVAKIKNDEALEMMKLKRKKHDMVIKATSHNKKIRLQADQKYAKNSESSTDADKSNKKLDMLTNEEIEETFKNKRNSSPDKRVEKATLTVVQDDDMSNSDDDTQQGEDDGTEVFIEETSSEKGSSQSAQLKKQKNEYYIKYTPSNYYQERGLGLADTFSSDVRNEVIDIAGDDGEMQRKAHNQKKWDRKKKKFVGVEVDKKNKRIKNEAGVWIKQSYNTKRYKDWKEKNNIVGGVGAESLGNNLPNARPRGRGNYAKQGKTPVALDRNGKRARDELRSKDEMLKERKVKERRRQHVQEQHAKKASRKKKMGRR